MEEVSSFVGIDVAQDQLALAVRPGGEAREVPNTDEGIKSIIGFIQELGPHLVVLEATGGMHIHLVAELASAGVAVAVVNPRQVRDFARATGKLAKTDALDAHVLAHFAEALQPESRPLPDATVRELGALVARRRQLVEMITAEKNRCRTATKRLQPQLQEHIRWLEARLKEMDQDLNDTIGSASMAGAGPVVA